MSRRNLFDSLYVRLSALILVGAIPALLAVGWVSYNRAERHRAEAEGELRGTADSLGASNGLLLGQAQHLLSSIAALPSIRRFSQNRPLCSEATANLMTANPRYAFIGVVDADGNLVCSGLPAVPGQATVGDRVWFQRVKATNDFAVGEFAIGRSSGRASLHLAFPVRNDEGMFAGAVDVALDLEWLSARLSRIQLPADVRVFILDQSGKVLAAHPGHTEVGSVFNIPASNSRSGHAPDVFEGLMPSGELGVFARANLGGASEGTLTVVTGQTEKSISGLIYSDALAAFATVLVSIVLGWLLATVGGYFAVGRPLFRLEGALGEIRRGNLSKPLDVPRSRGEISRVLSAFNQMGEQLRKQRAELDVAVAADQAKNTFIADMSHELRTPLNAILGFSDVLLAGIHGPLNSPKQREYLEDIHHAAGHQLDLINGILDLARIQSGRMDLFEELVDICDVIESSILLVRQRAIIKGVTLTFVDAGVRAAGINATIDPLRLKQVFLNLLTNAIKFTPAGGSITVQTAPTPSQGLRITFADTGVGMKAEDIPKALERFQQVGTQRLRKEGTGLGLAISRQLVEMHGGTLTLESQEGAGTTVNIELPPARVSGKENSGGSRTN